MKSNLSRILLEIYFDEEVEYYYQGGMECETITHTPRFHSFDIELALEPCDVPFVPDHIDVLKEESLERLNRLYNTVMDERAPSDKHFDQSNVSFTLSEWTDDFTATLTVESN